MPSTVIVTKEKLAKPPLSIYTIGDRVLRGPSKNVAAINDELRVLIRQMFQTMYSCDGIGLAAPQVGEQRRLIVIDTDPQEAANPVWVMINPVIKKFSTEVEKGEEGCLSVPNVFGDVLRSQMIVVNFRDETGKPRTIEAQGLLARVVQHEIDHLNGVLFVDHVDNQLSLAQDLTKQGFSARDVQRASR